MAYEVIFQPVGDQLELEPKDRSLQTIYLGKGAFWASFVPFGSGYEVYSLHCLDGENSEECRLIASFFAEGEYSVAVDGDPSVRQEDIFARPHEVLNVGTPDKPFTLTHTDLSQTERDVRVRHTGYIPPQPLINVPEETALVSWTPN